MLKPETRAPRIAELLSTGACHLVIHLAWIAGLLIPRVSLIQFLGQPDRLLFKLRLIPIRVIGVFRHRHIPAKLGFELVVVHDLGSREQSPGSAIMLFGLRFFRRFNHLRHADRVNFVARLHHLLFEVKKDLRKTRLFFRQGKYRFVYDLQSQRRMDALPMGIGDTKLDARVKFRVTNSHGEGVHAALGLQVVDEAVFALAEKQPGFAKVFFYLEQEVMKPRYEIHSIGMPEVVEPAEKSQAEQHDRAARALFSATEIVNDNKFETEFGRNVPMTKYANYSNRYQAQFKKQAIRLAKELNEAYAGNQKAGDPSKVYDEMARAGGEEFRDSWGTSLRLEHVPWDCAVKLVDDLASESLASASCPVGTVVIS